MSRLLNHGSFNHKEEHDLYSPCLSPTGRSSKTSPSATSPRTSRKTSPCTTPPKRSTKTNNNSSKEIKNPYSTRGLDKFSALLADLEEKKQKIYSQKDAEKISLVRFVYSSSTNDVVPIVIKSKDKDSAKRQEDKQQDKTTYDNKYPIESSPDASLESGKKTKKTNLSWNLGNLNHPAFYVPAIIIFILVLLAVFGRSVAILFTSIGWYIVPTITGDTLKSKKKPRRKKDLRGLNMTKIAGDGLKKKEYVRKASEIKMASDGIIASPKKETNNNGAAAVKNASPPSGHGHRKSW